MRKVVILIAMAALLGLAAFAYAGLAELDGKDFWFLLSDKDGKATGYIHETHVKGMVGSVSVINSTKTIYRKGTGKTIEIEYARESNNPLVSLTVKENGAVKLTGATVKEGWELNDGAKKKLLKKGDIDFFSYDDQGIFGDVKKDETKKLKIWDVVKNSKIEVLLKGYGSEEIQHEGKKFNAMKYDWTEGSSLTRYWVAKETSAWLSYRNENYNDHGKRVEKADVLKVFPNAK